MQIKNRFVYCAGFLKFHISAIIKKKLKATQI